MDVSISERHFQLPHERSGHFYLLTMPHRADGIVGNGFLHAISILFERKQSEESRLSNAKTNAVRLLERLGVAFRLLAYEVDPDDLAAESVADKLGLDPATVFKTLVARGDRTGVLLAVIPGNSQLDLKALARLSGDRSVATVPLKEVQPLTGYVRGGVTAMAGKRDYPVYFDETAELYEEISISAGTRGLQILLAPGDYRDAVSAKLGPISRPKS